MGAGPLTSPESDDLKICCWPIQIPEEGMAISGVTPWQSLASPQERTRTLEEEMGSSRNQSSGVKPCEKPECLGVKAARCGS